MRYLVTTRRSERGKVPSALDAVSADPGVTVVNSSDPQQVTIETNENTANELRAKIGETHFVEPEIRRSLE
ncbi:MAG TPA: hypothetical protein VIB39_18075 [Candidatus Angelobacter sp.]|jgi:hypothetical protein